MSDSPDVGGGGRRLAVLLLLVVGATAAVVSWRSLEADRGAARACDLLAEGRFVEAIAAAEAHAGPSGGGRRAAECRCVAQAQTGHLDRCLDDLTGLLRDPAAADWVPPLELTRLAVARLRDGGRADEGAALARRAAVAFPDDGPLRYLEFTVRAKSEGEEEAARALAAELGDGGEHADLRTLLATVFERRGDLAAAAEVLGDVPFAGGPDRRTEWYRARMRIAAASDDLDGLRALRQRWSAEPGVPAVLPIAAFATSLSLYQLTDPEVPTGVLLQAAVAGQEELPDDLAELCWRRLVSTLVATDQIDAAVEALGRGRERFELVGLSADELRRADLHFDETAEVGEVVFHLEHVPGGELLLSVAPPTPMSEPFAPAPGAGPTRSVRRPPGTHPLRWVVNSAEGPLASGNVFVQPGSTVEVTPRRAAASTPAAPPVPAAAATPPLGDGRSRVVLVLWDCADWRLVRYLLARGELPVLRTLLNRGARAVVHSSPPYTAAAVGALVRPTDADSAGVLATLFELGAEVGERRADHANPLSGLSWVLPVAPDTVADLGAGDRTVVNLLYSHGVLDAARHGEVVGPHGERGAPLQVAAFRPLTPAESARAPALEGTRVTAAPNLFAEAAALFDACQRLLEGGGVDVLLLRLGSLDVLSHGAYADVVSGLQDHGAGVLFDHYRYLDARTGDLLAQLDDDDWILVASDHGIRTSLQHDESAMFVLAGPGVVPGAVEGRPAWQGLARLIAELAGEEVDWPRSALSDLVPPADD